MEPRDISEAPAHVRTAILAYAAFNQRDFEAAVPAIDERKVCTTRAEIRQRLEALVRAFPDLTVRGLRATDLGNGTVAIRFVATGTNTGPNDADATVTDRAFEAEMFDVIRFDAGGRIIGGQNLSDVAPINAQLGLDDVVR
jgi:hypothetical protein